MLPQPQPAFVPARDWLRELELPCPLLSRDVRVWCVQLDLPDDTLAALQRLLSPDERDRAGRFLVESARRNFSATRGALRMILGHYLGSSPADVRFGYSQKGKPRLLSEQSATEIRFNVSHSGELALVVVGHGVEVGVDLERTDTQRDLFEIARLCMTAREQNLLQELAPEQWCQVFHRLWTRKEAVLKASGNGITSRLQELDVSEGAGATIDPGWLTVEFDAVSWLVCSLQPARGYEGALALERDRVRLPTKEI